jgi:DNA repair protein RecO (recombination protein O)
MNYKTQGIIIRRRNFGEADRILTIFTVDKGKISAIAKGVRKPLSHLGGHLELFYIVDLIMAEGRNFDIITASEVVEDLPNLRKNLQLTGKAYYVAEIIDKLINENQESKSIFKLIYNTLSGLNNDKNHLILNYFELQLLSHLGHKPELLVCVKCRNKLSSNTLWSSSSGGTICQNCRQGVGDYQVIDSNAIKVMRLLLSEDINVIDRLNISNDLDNELEKIINDYLEQISEKKFLTKNFIKGTNEYLAMA